MSENSEIGTMWENQLVMEKFSDLFDDNGKIIEDEETWDEFLEFKYNKVKLLKCHNQIIVFKLN